MAPLTTSIVPEDCTPGAEHSSSSARKIPPSPKGKLRHALARLGLIDNDSEVCWQWLLSKDGKDEWKNYSAAENQAIEKRFQSGATHLRMHSGKATSDKGNLKELFFGDMVQYNPISGKVRDIRRLGPDNVFKKTKRYIIGYLEHLEKGTVRHKSFLQYKNKHEGFSSKSKTSLVSQKAVRSAWCERTVRRGAFIVIQMLAILLNTVCIGFDVEYNGPEAPETTRFAFQIIDHAFCVFFTVEIILRFGAMKKQASTRKVFRNTLKDGWFVFDFILVFFMVVETWLLPLILYSLGGGHGATGLDHLATFRILRLMRLSRLGRVGRLLKYFPETLAMVKSIVAALRAVFCTFGMLLAMLYVFAIIFKTRCEQTPIQEMFPSIAGSMWLLLLNGAFMDDMGDVMESIWAEDGMLAALFLMFIFLSNLTVLNMLIGVICDVANQVSTRERELAAAKLLKQDLMEFIECFDMNDDKTIDVQEFGLLMGNPDVTNMLERHDVDVEVLMGMEASLFTDKAAMEAAEKEAHESLDDGFDGGKSVCAKDFATEKLSYDELVTVILRLSGGKGNQASAIDLINLESSLQTRMKNIEKTTNKSHTYIRKTIEHLNLLPVDARSSSKVTKGDPVPQCKPPPAAMSDTAQHSGVPDCPYEQPSETAGVLCERQIEISPAIREDDLRPQLQELAPQASQQSKICAETTSKKPPGGARIKPGSVMSASDEWGCTQMHVGFYERPRQPASKSPKREEPPELT